MRNYNKLKCIYLYVLEGERETMRKRARKKISNIINPGLGYKNKQEEKKKSEHTQKRNRKNLNNDYQRKQRNDKKEAE